MTVALAAKPVRKTYRDFSRLSEGTLAQLIDGEIIMSPAPRPKHQQIIGRLYYELETFCRNKGTVLLSPVDVYFDNHETYQPDIVFITKEREYIIGETKIEGSPDLVVEILSDSTAYYDLKHKKNVYEAHGVKEYWVVDPKEQTVEIFTLEQNQPENKYRLASEYKQQGIAKSLLLAGFQIAVEDIFS